MWRPPTNAAQFGSGPATKLTLYCFPHAGGAASFFRSWPTLMPTGVGFRAVQLPGRQDLRDVCAFTDVGQVARAAADAVTADAGDTPFAFFGHSMGALSAFETARELRRRASSIPAFLGLSGHRAPHLANTSPTLHTLPEAQLLAAIRSLGGIPPEVTRSPELIDLVLPVIRADLELLAAYDHEQERPLECPFFVFGGSEDHLVTENSLRAWGIHTTTAIRLEQFSGDHFYLTRWSSRIVATMCGMAGPTSESSLVAASR